MNYSKICRALLLALAIISPVLVGFSICLLIVNNSEPETIEYTPVTVTYVVRVEPIEVVITDTDEPEKPVRRAIDLGEFTLTAYCPCEKCCGVWATKRPVDEAGKPIVYTSTGAIALAGRTIAVDPEVIPYGTEVMIDGHTYVAEDCGGAIKENRIDIYFDNHQEALKFGKQTKNVSMIEVGD